MSQRQPPGGTVGHLSVDVPHETQGDERYKLETDHETCHI